MFNNRKVLIKGDSKTGQMLCCPLRSWIRNSPWNNYASVEIHLCQSALNKTWWTWSTHVPHLKNKQADWLTQHPVRKFSVFLPSATLDGVWTETCHNLRWPDKSNVKECVCVGHVWCRQVFLLPFSFTRLCVCPLVDSSSTFVCFIHPYIDFHVLCRFSSYSPVWDSFLVCWNSIPFSWRLFPS